MDIGVNRISILVLVYWLPAQIEPLMRAAFDAGTVREVRTSTQDAAQAAQAAAEEVRRTGEVRRDVARLLDKQYAMINRLAGAMAQLERHHAANASAIETLLRRRPWWWLTRQQPRKTPPNLPS